MVSTRGTRTEKLDLRLSAAAKEMIYAAASATHQSVSEFVVESALARAEEALADRRTFFLNAEQWAQFLTALDAPPRDMPGLEQLMREPSIFEESDES